MPALLENYASRARVTSSDDPASFENGSDLLRRDGRPWSRPLYILSKQSRYFPLYEKLREDRLVPDNLDAVFSTLPFQKIIYSRGQVCYTLNDTFIVRFSGRSLTLTVITEQGVESLCFERPFADSRDSIVDNINPYTGAYKNHHLY
jgi:hypothetical protein